MGIPGFLGEKDTPAEHRVHLAQRAVQGTAGQKGVCGQGYLGGGCGQAGKASQRRRGD